jgi:antitoxin MazE
MTKKLCRHGNSLALIIDKPILEMLSITEDTVIKIKTDGKNIILEPLHCHNNALNKNPKLKAIFDEITETYAEDLAKLADS